MHTKGTPLYGKWTILLIIEDSLLFFSLYTLFTMCAGSGCEGEVTAKSLTEATAEGSLLSISKFEPATDQ